MSYPPVDKPNPAVTTGTFDPLLVALRQLPSLANAGSAETRLQRQARDSYARSFERSTWYSSAPGFVGRATVPVFLAGIVGLYLTWAIGAAAALVQ